MAMTLEPRPGSNDHCSQNVAHMAKLAKNVAEREFICCTCMREFAVVVLQFDQPHATIPIPWLAYI